MVSIKLNGVTYHAPVCWEDTTTAQFLKLDEWDRENPAELYNIMCNAQFENTDFGVGGDDIARAIALEQLIIAFAFLFDKGFNFQELPVPIAIEVLGVKVLVPKDLGGLSVGQAIMLRQLMDDEGNSNQLVAKAAAIYLQPIIDGRVDSKRVDVVETALLAMPCTTIFPIGFFLLKRLGAYGNLLQRIWRRLNLWRSNKRAEKARRKGRLQ